MPVKTIFFTIVLLFLIPISTVGCSCERIYFCEFIKREDPTTAIRAIPIQSKVYSENNAAVYLKVIELFRNDHNITDTIKVYGKEITADCSVDVLSTFPIGQEVYLAFGSEDEPLNNPDSLHENYYENRLFLCATITLRVIGNDVIKGRISENAFFENFYGITEYPLEAFRQQLNDCSYSLEDLEGAACENSDFLVYPNPYKEGTITISTDFWTYQFDQVVVYNFRGQLIGSISDISNYRSLLETMMNRLPNGIYLFIIYCGEERITRKIVIERERG